MTFPKEFGEGNSTHGSQGCPAVSKERLAINIISRTIS
jgi:hypothetical protein